MRKRDLAQLLRTDWDVIAGITAALAALILHLLHVVNSEVIFTIVLVLLALLLIRDLRRESVDEELASELHEIKSTIQGVESALNPPEAVLVGPRNLRPESQKFCESACGEMVWFNVCFMMFHSQDVFDIMLRPAIENKLVTSIQFVSDKSEKSLWDQNMAPKIAQCVGREKVREPRWNELPQTMSFIMADTNSAGNTEALLSFWGEPFMGRRVGQQSPRFIFRVKSHSELVTRLAELERDYRLVQAQDQQKAES